ncbi:MULTISPECIES: 6-pyruvoyl trahydropterin synthase family protein [Empedobacter]|uniref:6-carboxy-5,6,7,8-tetrahydropterin synthase n=1 Tax=Empedobacter falsenii TaxID=343874 RepID=A0A427BHE1_9FLAO|nr:MULTISPECIES: 6-carboxytetrahydropterin synthase [Empedobacter]HBX63254.1 6-pyruvoyl tetrahydrobiopterin synthase [Flavobacteriaceae bacterium]MBW1617258.1 6-carboxytetrahydropterin synthase [Empedobacter falsenii]MBY0065785.1 6-carboxytetrahydropterin synthase [Empedobacter falsenii]MDM1137335.1 6-carboxytetrahydropterin synthase [Empedobacter sp. R132-2]RRT87509.1 6-carboxytetrahydropterin synthase [Empedobacter falsenii]
MKVTVNRKAHFNAAHRLFNKNWSDEQNFEVFGKCSYPNYHGHNYEIIVAVKGEVDPETGFVMNLDELRKIIAIEVEDYLDHKNLNVDIEEFKTINPTAENIVILIWNKIRAKLATDLELKVTLYETPRNFVEYAGE